MNKGLNVQKTKREGYWVLDLRTLWFYVTGKLEGYFPRIPNLISEGWETSLLYITGVVPSQILLNTKR